MANTFTPYRGSIAQNDIINSATVTLVPGQYITIGEVVVQADEVIAMGYGAFGAQDQADGRIYVDLKDASSNAIEGMFRIMTLSGQDLPVGSQPVVIDVDLAALAQGGSDRTTRLPFPCTNVFLSKDKKYAFQVMNTAASAQTVSKAKSVAMIDITRGLV